MREEDLLLDESEINKLMGKPNIGVSIYKAAQLKLLEWLNKRCTEHPQYDEEVGGNLHKFYYSHQDCPECMSELESKLKE